MYSGGMGAALFFVGSLGSSVPGGVWSSIHLQASSLLLWAVIHASGWSHTAVTIETRQGPSVPASGSACPVSAVYRGATMAISLC